jgi:cytochrome c553
VVACRSMQVAATLASFLFFAQGAVAGDATAGARLAAARCASCHSSSQGIHSMLPLLEGQPKTYFIAQWGAFRDRKRTAPIMVGLAAELSKKDVDDLAEHYAALVPTHPVQLPGSDAGRELADRLHCASCHGPSLQGTATGAARLAGQKAGYTTWSLQLMRGGNRSHGAAGSPDPLLATLSNADMEALAAYFASIR